MGFAANCVAACRTVIPLLLLVAGCSESIDPTPEPEPDVIETDLTDPAAVIEAQSRAWQEQNYEAYDALLDEEFEFYPLAEDAEDFPWMGGHDSWNRAAELSMAGNMFDDAYMEGNESIDLIEMLVTPESIQSLDGGQVEVIGRHLGRAMWSATDGAFFDTRMKFTLITRDGFLRIREIRELPRVAGSRGATSVENASWGNIKSLYRTPIDVGHTDPQSVIEAYTQVWNEQDYGALERLLDNQYEFYPLPEDADNIPWMVGDSWGRTSELGLAFNMFDDGYTQGVGSIALIDVETTTESVQPQDSGAFEVQCIMNGRVLWTKSDGWIFHSRLIFELAPRNGILRVREIREVPSGLRDEGFPTTWGLIRASYK
jgi:hypothetical protein